MDDQEKQFYLAGLELRKGLDKWLTIEEEVELDDIAKQIESCCPEPPSCSQCNLRLIRVCDIWKEVLVRVKDIAENN